MTLHEAIIQTLKATGKPMTKQEIAALLNQTKLYTKRDGSKITSYQIHGRVKNYPHLFVTEGSRVWLKETAGYKMPVNKKAETKSESKNVEDITLTEVEQMLMNAKMFKPASNINGNIPSQPGMYCIRIKNPNVLPGFFGNVLHERKHNIVYIGIASKSLQKRLNQELRAKGHGTFFRSIGAVLGYCPPFNSLKNKKNKRNYKFSENDEGKIIDWINNNLLVNWVITNDFKKLEAPLIRKYKPLLNIDLNPYALPELKRLRKKCQNIANGVQKE